MHREHRRRYSTRKLCSDVHYCIWLYIPRVAISISSYLYILQAKLSVPFPNKWAHATVLQSIHTGHCISRIKYKSSLLEHSTSSREGDRRCHRFPYCVSHERHCREGMSLISSTCAQQKRNANGEETYEQRELKKLWKRLSAIVTSSATLMPHAIATDS